MGLSLPRIGVFGGAFDPPHRAHVALAQAAVAQLGLAELRIFPTGQAWHKARPLSSAAARLAMAELAFAALPNVTVDAREIRRILAAWSRPLSACRQDRHLRGMEPGP